MKNLLIVAMVLLAAGMLFTALYLTAVGGESVNKCTVFCRNGAKVSCEGENTTTFKEKDDEGCICDEKIVRCNDNARNDNKNAHTNTNHESPNRNNSADNTKKQKKNKKN